jgi:hypothetical protein
LTISPKAYYLLRMAQQNQNSHNEKQLSDAEKEAASLKAEFRREDEELYRQGRGVEVWADRMKSLGITEGGTTRLVTVNGVRFRN